MDFEITKDGKMNVFTKDYINESIDDVGEDILNGAETPATKYVFEICDDKDTVVLNEGKSEMFHHIVAKLLYMSKRARVDIDLAVNFFRTRVS